MDVLGTLRRRRVTRPSESVVTVHPLVPPREEPVDPNTTASAGRRSEQATTRRHLLAAAVGVGVTTVIARAVDAQAGTVLTAISGPATALSPAQRIGPVDVPPDPPAEGEILFPIEVGPDDYCYVIDGFGDCRGTSCSRSHAGVDILADRGLTIRAPASGELTHQYVDSGETWGAGHGWTLRDDSGVVWKFFHMDRHADGLEVGNRVSFGQTIGFVGNTGTSGVPTGTNHHLHFEYRPGNVPADPFPLLERDPDVVFES